MPPLLGAIDQSRSKGIALNVARDRIEMLILLNREGLEAALVKMPRARGVMASVPPLRVRQREPAKEVADFTAGAASRPDDEVPVRRHDAKEEDPQRRSLMGFDERAYERLVVAGPPKERCAAVASIEHVVDQTADQGSRATRHGDSITRRPMGIHE